MYKVKEMFLTLQGEGYWVGRPAVFVRFSGCNLWSGREDDRSDAACKFCDTDFLGGESLSMGDICQRAAAIWSDAPRADRFCVLTGGEPTLQAFYPLVEALHRFEFYVAMETNGTRMPPKEVDWLTVSPKAGAPLAIEAGDELKLVYPQVGAEPEKFVDLRFNHFFLQPMDGPELGANTKAAVEYCLSNPKWRLSVQTHKVLGLR